MSDFSLNNNGETLYFMEKAEGEYQITINDGLNSVLFDLWPADLLYMRDRLSDAMGECVFEREDSDRELD